MKKAKLIEEIKRKIEAFDNALETIKEATHDARSRDDKNHLEDLRESRNILNAKRQENIQFLADLEELN